MCDRDREVEKQLTIISTHMDNHGNIAPVAHWNLSSRLLSSMIWYSEFLILEAASPTIAPCTYMGFVPSDSRSLSNNEHLGTIISM